MTACEPALGWGQGTFCRAYEGNRKGSNQTALDSSPVIRPLRLLLAEAPWQGTASGLLNELNRRASDEARRSRSWPQDARKLGGELRRLAPNLREAGIAVDFTQRRTARGVERFIILDASHGRPASPSAGGEGAGDGFE